MAYRAYQTDNADIEEEAVEFVYVIHRIQIVQGHHFC